MKKDLVLGDFLEGILVGTELTLEMGVTSFEEARGSGLLLKENGATYEGPHAGCTEFTVVPKDIG